MRIEIVNAFTNDGSEYFRWRMWDGPDGIEEVRGFAIDLPAAFTKICVWREKIAQEYINENLTEENETNC